MHASRTTFSFLDLALMLLSAFAYSHFIGLAEEAIDGPTAENAKAKLNMGHYEYDPAAFFGSSNVMLTDFARAEILEKLAQHAGNKLIISVPPEPADGNNNRLRQWEKVAARSAAIADAFVAGGMNGQMIEIEMPNRLSSESHDQDEISLVFRATSENLRLP